MRPLRLTLEAFGSYGDELTVDFARLGRHGIFAITGPTGAGKSTIFDALVYALYADLPGFRVDGNVRSQYADAGTETRVCLEFEVHAEQWRIERRPTQWVRRRRGEGAPVEQTSRVALVRLDAAGVPVEGTCITRKAAVAAKVEELVGLTKEQFEQVVLIPQGKFEEVLKAETGKRAPLLRRLFPVEIFGRVTEALRAITATRQAAFEEADRAYAAVVGKLGEAVGAAWAQVPDGLAEASDEAFCVGELSRWLEELRRAREALGGLVDRATVDEDRAHRALDTATAALRRWDEWQADLRAAAGFEAGEREDDAEGELLDKARRLVDLRPVLAEWAEASSLEDASSAERDALLAALGDAWLDPYDRESLSDAGHAALLAQRVDADAREMFAAVARYEGLAAEADALEEARQSLDLRRDALRARNDELDSEAAGLDHLAQDLEAARVASQAVDRLSAGLDALEAELVAAERRVQIREDCVRLAAQRAAAAAQVTGARRRADAARSSWRDGLAGRLAQLLADGQPCPTCGALEHPRPAVFLDGAPGDEMLAAADRGYEEALALSSELELRLAVLEAEVVSLGAVRDVGVVDAEAGAARDALRESVTARELFERLAEESARRTSTWRAGRSAADARDRELSVEAATLAAHVAAHEKDRADYVALHGDFVSPSQAAEARRGLAVVVSELSRVLHQLEGAQAARARCLAILAPVVEGTGAADPSELARWTMEPDKIAARAGALAARRERRQVVLRRIADYTRGGGPAEPPELEPLAAALAEVRDRRDDLVRRLAVLEDELAFATTGPDLLEAAEKEIVTARRALEQAKTVADQCAGLGTAASGSRLSLENWVLADYLRQVLVQANVRLSTMTDGRFALELSDGVTDGRKPWGLDLSVFDVYTGQVRPATTLSGGETFMAALALALGLADVVSGGSNREMGALFVDEGFGSLDPQALDAVVDVLRSLEDGGRIVGVISHVEELQQALPTGITVAPSLRGSVAEVHYPAD